MLHGAFTWDADAIAYHGDHLVCRAVAGRGWTALSVAGDAFLAPLPDGAAIVLTGRGGPWCRFPTCSLDGEDGGQQRAGAVSDGIDLIRIAPDLAGRGFELTVGFNVDEPRDAVLLLSPGIRVRGPGPDRCRGELLDPARDRCEFAHGAVLIHPSGRSILLEAPCRLDAPDLGDGERGALVIPCRGFHANPVSCVVDPQPRSDWFLERPRLHLDGPLPPLHAAQDVHPEHGCVVLDPDRPPRATLAFTWRAGSPLAAVAYLDTRHSLERETVTWRHAVAVDAGEHTIDLGELVLARPGIHELTLRLTDRDECLLWCDRFRVAWDVDRFEPDILVSPDFDAFWDETLAELRSHDLAPELRRVDHGEQPDWRLWEVELTAWAGRRIHCLMFEPADRDGPLPAIVGAHPGGRGWGANRGPDGMFGAEIEKDPRFLTITPLIRGHAPDAEDIPFNHPWWGPMGERDDYVARAWYCAMVRAVDYLATRPDLVDLDRVVSWGGSQGGALALVLAGLDERIAACGAVAPSNAQPHELLRGCYPAFGPHPGQAPPDRGVEATAGMLSYYDPVNFCPRIRCETHVSINIGDGTVHAMGPLACWRNLTALPPERRRLHTGSLITHKGPTSLDETGRDDLLARVVAGGLRAGGPASSRAGAGRAR